MNKLIAVTLALLAIALNGCGTMSWIACGPVPPSYYAGVQCDAEIVGQCLKSLREPPFSKAGEGQRTAPDGASYALLFLADMPLSAIADTIALPLVFAGRLAWDEKQRQGEAANHNGEDSL